MHSDSDPQRESGRRRFRLEAAVEREGAVQSGHGVRKPQQQAIAKLFDDSRAVGER
jgi:hypothetical protein